MTTNEVFGRSVSSWLHEDAEHHVPDHLDEILRATATTRQRPAWSSLERWLPVDTTFTRRLAPAPRYAWLLVILALLVALSAVILAVGSLPRNANPFGLARNGSVVYAGSDGDIYARDPVTGVTTPLVTGPEIDLAPTFSNDGSRFVFAREAAAAQHHRHHAGERGRYGRPPADGTVAQPLSVGVVARRITAGRCLLGRRVALDPGDGWDEAGAHRLWHVPRILAVAPRWH